MTNQTTVATITYLVYRAHRSAIMEDVTFEIVDNERNPQLAAKTAPSAAFAFFYFDVEVERFVDIEGKLVEAASSRRHLSKTYYIDAELLTHEQGAALLEGGDFMLMLREMRVRGQDAIVRCRTGNIVPFDTRKDELIVTR